MFVINPIRFVIRLIGLICALFIVLPFIIIFIAISQQRKNRLFNKKVVAFWSQTLCFVCGIKLKLKGKIHKNPVLIVANHVTWLDIPVIHKFKLAGFVAKQEISQWPILGWVVKSGETLFIKRGKQESRKKVLEAIKSRLTQGRSIAVFPEGKVTDGNQLARFHRQLLHAAIETQTPIQAIAIKYINNDGNRNKQIGFINDEHFIKNVMRILCIPSSTAELTFCDPIETNNINARQAALITHQQVETILKQNDYM